MGVGWGRGPEESVMWWNVVVEFDKSVCISARQFQCQQQHPEFRQLCCLFVQREDFLVYEQGDRS